MRKINATLVINNLKNMERLLKEFYIQPGVRVMEIHSRGNVMQTLSNGENLNKKKIEDDDFWA